MLVCFSAQIVLFSALYFFAVRDNRKASFPFNYLEFEILKVAQRDALQAATAQDSNSDTAIVLGLADLTDVCFHSTPSS